jgi:large conductance mechanosensitive channel
MAEKNSKGADAKKAGRKEKIEELKEKDAQRRKAAAEKGGKFVGEFKEFVSQGNIMDLAVGVVIGTAFTGIVTSVVNDIIMPIVGLIVGGVDFTELEITVANFFGGDTAAHIRYGNFLQAAVNFLIIAFTLFLVMKAMNQMRKQAQEKLGREKAKEEKKEEEKKDETIELLKEIRDSLKK